MRSQCSILTRTGNAMTNYYRNTKYWLRRYPLPHRSRGSSSGHPLCAVSDAALPVPRHGEASFLAPRSCNAEHSRCRTTYRADSELFPLIFIIVITDIYHYYHQYLSYIESFYILQTPSNFDKFTSLNNFELWKIFFFLKLFRCIISLKSFTKIINRLLFWP